MPMANGDNGDNFRYFQLIIGVISLFMTLIMIFCLALEKNINSFLVVILGIFFLLGISMIIKYYPQIDHLISWVLVICFCIMLIVPILLVYLPNDCLSKTKYESSECRCNNTSNKKVTIDFPKDNTKFSDDKIDLMGNVSGISQNGLDYTWIFTSGPDNTLFYPQEPILICEGRWYASAYITSSSGNVIIAAVDSTVSDNAKKAIKNYIADNSSNKHLSSVDLGNKEILAKIHLNRG